jgi:hypothetical protein
MRQASSDTLMYSVSGQSTDDSNSGGSENSDYMSSSARSQEELGLESDEREEEKSRGLGQGEDASRSDDGDRSFDGDDENDAPDPPVSAKKDPESSSMMENNYKSEPPTDSPVEQKKEKKEKKKKKKAKKPRAADEAKTSDPVLDNGHSNGPRPEKEGAAGNGTRSIDLSSSADLSPEDESGVKKKSKKKNGKKKKSKAATANADAPLTAETADDAASRADSEEGRAPPMPWTPSKEAASFAMSKEEQDDLNDAYPAYVLTRGTAFETADVPATAEAESDSEKPKSKKKKSKKAKRKAERKAQAAQVKKDAEDSQVATPESDKAFDKVTPKKSKSKSKSKGLEAGITPKKSNKKSKQSERTSKVDELLENMVQDASTTLTNGTDEFDAPKVKKKKKKSKKAKRKAKANSSGDEMTSVSSDTPKLKNGKSKLNKPIATTPFKAKSRAKKRKDKKKREKVKKDKAEITSPPIDVTGEALTKEDEKKSEDEAVGSESKKKKSKKDKKKKKSKDKKNGKAKQDKKVKTDEEGKKAKKGKKKGKGLNGKSSHSKDSKGSKSQKKKKKKDTESRKRGRKEDFVVPLKDGDESLLIMAPTSLPRPFGVGENDKSMMLSTHSVFTNEEEKIPADNDPMICIRINRIKQKMTELCLKTQQELYYMEQHTEREKDALMEKIGMSNDPEEAIGHIQTARIKRINNQDKRLQTLMSTMDQGICDEIALAAKLTTEAQELQLRTGSLLAHIQRKEEKIARNSCVVANLAYLDSVIG